MKSDFKPDDIAVARCKEITKECLKIRDWNNSTLISKYAHEKGILGYLKTCTVEIEKDIYVAAGETASINYVRAPFYPVIESQKDESFESFINSLDFQTLATSLVNLKPSQMDTVVSVFTPKKQYLLQSLINSMSHEVS